MRKPTEVQILGAKIRAEEEAWEKKHRKPCGGGWLVPPRVYRDAHLSKVFGLTPYQLSLYLTYSRSCDHPWSKGACPDCPGHGH